MGTGWFRFSRTEKGGKLIWPCAYVLRRMNRFKLCRLLERAVHAFVARTANNWGVEIERNILRLPGIGNVGI